MAQSDFSVTITSESGVIFFGDCKALFVPSAKGTMAILRLHTPMIMRLSSGEISIRQGNQNTVICSIKEGLARVEENEAIVLVVESSPAP